MKAPCRSGQGHTPPYVQEPLPCQSEKRQGSAFATEPPRLTLSPPPDKKKTWAGHGRPTAKTDAHFAKLRRAERDDRERRLGPLPDEHAPPDGVLRLFGVHAVEAAIKNPKRLIKRLYATENAERRLIEAVGTLSHPVERVTPRDLDRLLGTDTVHQGIMLETEELAEPSFAELIANASGRPLIVLDQVTDPHNVGAILRSAAVFGAAGVVMPRRHSPPLNGVLAKSASGALELVPVALVPNLARALSELKDLGFRIVGLDGEAEASLEDIDWAAPTALVMGAEGKGLRQLTAETADLLAHITTDGPIASLNVSNAAAIALHTAALSRLKAKG